MDPKPPPPPLKLGLPPGQPTQSIQVKPAARPAAVQEPEAEEAEQCTTRELAFVAAFIANNFETEKAMLAVGYSAETARAGGARLRNRPRVQRAIMEALAEVIGPADEVRRRFITDLCLSVFVDKTQAFDDYGNVKPLSQWPEILRKRLRSLTKTESERGSSIKVEFESNQQDKAMLKELMNMDRPQRIDVTSGGQPIQALPVTTITIAGVEIPVPALGK